MGKRALVMLELHEGVSAEGVAERITGLKGVTHTLEEYELPQEVNDGAHAFYFEGVRTRLEGSGQDLTDSEMAIIAENVMSDVYLREELVRAVDESISNYLEKKRGNLNVVSGKNQE